eukprot:gnl/TRDRNA2_/TRDRNA2_30780_c0_seq1.p1 gnl/TRDRNA2_/TRDRNA2_30780_c0~~gnl/TRDRNA2_/TRDRNA2_30780_c0_seq1.p1  ORF type:complete len:280 (+),score=42.58 gnl/TRDRNA2_/TRDRNA2_30780_c0_seq1:78-917(+)
MLMYRGILAVVLATTASASRTVVLTGATGRTGVPTYAALRRMPEFTVRAFVRNATKAKTFLNCTKCDQSEGVFEGDITKPETMRTVMADADTLVITTGASPQCHGLLPHCKFPPGGNPKDINWLGVKAQVSAFAKAGGKQVVLMSTMDTTVPNNFLDKMAGGHVTFYSLQGEAFVMNSGLNFTIVKACGLGDDSSSKNKLLAGHDDGSWSWAINHEVTRGDVARVLAAAVESPARSAGLRFDLCSSPFGSATADAREVLDEAMYPWDPRKPKQDKPLLV